MLFNHADAAAHFMRRKCSILPTPLLNLCGRGAQFRAMYSILQNDIGNKYSQTTIVAPMTTKSKTYVSMHVKLKESFLAKRSTLLLEQIRTIDKRRLIKKMGSLSENSMAEIERLLDKNFYI